MAKVPAMRQTQIPYRGENESAAQNRFQEDVLFDLVEAFNDLNAQKVMIKDLAEVALTQNKFLQLRLLQLQNQLAALGETAGVARAFVTDFLPTTDPVGIQRLHVDEIHRVATLPVVGEKVSKLYLKDALTREPFVPASTGVEVIPTANGVTVIDQNLRSAVDGNERTTWVRSVVAPLSSDMTAAVAQILITVPDDIVSNRDVNMITVNQFPAQSVDIVNVEYIYNDVPVQVPGFRAQEQAGPIKLCFPTRPVAQVRVTLRQRHWIEENGQKVFYLGAAEIEVAKQTYAAPRGEFMVPITLPGDGPFKIESITPMVGNQAALSVDARSLFTYSLYTVDDSGNLVYTQDQLPVQVHRKALMLKATLHVDAENGASPTLESIVVRYQAP